MRLLCVDVYTGVGKEEMQMNISRFLYSEQICFQYLMNILSQNNGGAVLTHPHGTELPFRCQVLTTTLWFDIIF